MSAQAAVSDRAVWRAHNVPPAWTSQDPGAAVRDCTPGEMRRTAVAAIVSFLPTATPSLALTSDASARGSHFVAAGLAVFSPAGSPAASTTPPAPSARPVRSTRTALHYHCAFAPAIRILEKLLPAPLACGSYPPPPPPDSATNTDCSGL